MQLSLSGLILFGTAAIVLVARHYAHKAVAQAAAAENATATAAPSASVPRHILAQARAPVLAFIAIWGLYFALSVILFRVETYADTLLDLVGWAKTTALVVVLFWFLFRLINVLEREWSPRSHPATRKWNAILVVVMFRALRLILPLFAVLRIVPTLDIPERMHAALQDGASVLLIAFIGVVFCQLATTAEQAIQTEYRVDVSDNLATRKIQTQVGILKKIAVALIILVTLACVLTVFAPVRALGSSILASAGVAGIVLGIAAQRSLGTLFGGNPDRLQPARSAG